MASSLLPLTSEIMMMMVVMMMMMMVVVVTTMMMFEQEEQLQHQAAMVAWHPSEHPGFGLEARHWQ